MNVSCIILNYNDADTTIRLVQSIKEYYFLDSIVIVDNHSTDDSADRLKELSGGRIHVVSSLKNGGYGYGNNLGIRYAYSELGATHVLIANPDVLFSQETLLAMKALFTADKSIAVTAAVPEDQSGKAGLPGWKLTGLFADLLDTGLVTRRLLKRWLTYDPHKHAFLAAVPGGTERCAWADAVPGSLLLADADALTACGLYDEEVFLYYEEKILGHQLKEKGYGTLLLLDRTYVHLHSVSINKSVSSILKKQALLHRSKLHYYKKYLKINRFQELTAKGFLNFLMFEIWFLTKILRMSW
ncbi:glycosyltransferase [Clostridium boliviensis]|uniref:Glycosyltransferase n=1 Tax=Clostridium boliviensis TaxID=318465 RepID=A0ABU4GQ25_9CLOT|nr:glycosyltransferase [Clostridium boliviensis]MDW2799736.1 glycosyltransferase [Clostridium boliviensis]